MPKAILSGQELVRAVPTLHLAFVTLPLRSLLFCFIPRVVFKTGVLSILHPECAKSAVGSPRPFPLRNFPSAVWLILPAFGKIISLLTSSLTFALLLLTFFLSTEAAEPQLQVPQDFIIERATTPGSVIFPMFACFGDNGRMFVAESSGLDLYAELQQLTRRCRISILEDFNNDGLFDKSRVFAEELVFPMGLVWQDGKLYVADPPELVTLEDSDRDGRADKRTVILKEFGHTDDGSLHGLVFGPDGWLYLTMGQPDGYRIERADGVVLEGKSGALIRCKPDGSGAEVIARGFENLVEIAFMPTGEVVGTDNWFMMPNDGMRDALVHLVEGGLYPLQLRDTGTKFFRSAEPLPAIKIYPAVANSGLVRYRGTQFPMFRGHLFSAQFNTRRVIRRELSRFGATFQSVDTDFVTTEDPDFHPSDVLEGADGSLYIVDTGSWYVHHCPTGRIRKVPGQGAIYRVSHKSAKKTDDPWGTRMDLEKVDQPELFKRAKDERWAVRDRAMKKLIEGKAADSEAWIELVASEFKEEALWALARIGTDGTVQEVRKLLASSEPETRILGARILGRIADRGSRQSLERLLKNTDQRVRFVAAEALAHCGTAESIPALVEALTIEADVFMEHAALFALYKLSKPAEQLPLLNHPYARVKKAGLVLLEQTNAKLLQGKTVASLAFHEDDALAKTARNILAAHPEWIDEAAGILRQLLERKTLTTSEQEGFGQFVRTFGLKDPVAPLITSALNPHNENISAFIRITLLQAISRLAAENIPPDWKKEIAACVSTPELSAAAIRAANSLRLEGLESEFAARANDNSAPSTLRMEALRGIVRTRRKLEARAVNFLLAQGERPNKPAVRLAALEVLAAAELEPAAVTDVLRTFRGDPLASPNLLMSLIRRNGVHPDSEPVIVEFIKSYGNIPGEDLKWLEAKVSEASRKSVKEIQQKQAAEFNARTERLKELEPLTTGGDFNRGQQLFAEKVACVACHRVGKMGGVSGPDLTKIGAIRSGGDLLESLLIPSATFAQEYETYQVKLKDGTEVTGVRVRQPDDTLVIRDAAGTETLVESNQLESIRRTEVSLMPEGLLDSLKPSEIQDLLAYLQSLK
jgi:putative membrane-bound dehydrogenase-like protein